MEIEPYTNNQTKVLILSDRLLDRANELAEYLRSVNIYVVALVENKQQALQAIQNQSIDYLIIAGFLKDESSYGVIEALRKQYLTFIPVHWAMLDSLINDFCIKYKIPLQFERTLPLKEFADYLQIHKNDKWSYCKKESNIVISYKNPEADKAKDSTFRELIKWFGSRWKL